MGFLSRVDNGITAFKEAFKTSLPPNYARLNNGFHSYNYETERFSWLGFLGIGQQYYKPKENLKWYYENIPFFCGLY